MGTGLAYALGAIEYGLSNMENISQVGLWGILYGRVYEVYNKHNYTSNIHVFMLKLDVTVY